MVSLLFIIPGLMKLSQPIAILSTSLPWTAHVPVATVRLIGILDLCGGIGILIPTLLRIQPQVTVWAALGNMTLMVSAIAFHLSRGESKFIGFHIMLISILAFIAWGRTYKAAVYARG